MGGGDNVPIRDPLAYSMSEVRKKNQSLLPINNELIKRILQNIGNLLGTY